MKSLALLLLKGLIIAALLNAGPCKPPPPFPGGIRMVSFEAPAENPSDQSPVDGVADSGQKLSQVGSGNGNMDTFEGYTQGPYGIDDHPLARDNANWQVTWNFATIFSPAPCNVGQQTHFVPLGGAEFDETRRV